MARGSEAKSLLFKKIIDALGDCYLGCEDGKKYYFVSRENGEEVQVCLQASCPKTLYGGGSQSIGAFEPAPADNDQMVIDDLMERLGFAK